MAKPNMCQDCKYFFLGDVNSPGCRRYPPQAGKIISFPLVGKDWWCGEFKPSTGKKQGKEGENGTTRAKAD